MPYGQTEVPVAIPDENLAGLLSPPEDPSSQDLESLVGTALQCAVGGKTLLEAARRANKTVIAFNHESVPCTLLANHLASRLLQAKAQDVSLLERASDPTQPRSSRIFPEKDLETPCPVERHDPRISSSVKVGQLDDGTGVLLNEAFASAELRCTITDVAINPFWGYSGGPSFVVPGLASEKTIKNCVRPAMRGARLPAVLTGNPTYETLNRASQAQPVDFAIHLVERPDGRIAGAFVGDFMATFEQACALSAKTFRQTLQRKVDIVISSAGGAPWDRTLFDASPSIIMATTACKDHGILILVAECPEGLGKFPSSGSTIRDQKARLAQSRRTLSLEGLLEHSLQKTSSEHRTYLVSTLPEHQASLYSLLTAKSVGSAVQRATRHVGKDAKIALMPYGSHTAASIA